MKRNLVTAEVKAELDQIAKENDGLIRPDDVVKVARQRGTALHGYMGALGLWNKNTAQEVALKLTARHLIKSVRVTVIDERNEAQRMPRYVSLIHDRSEGRGYRDVLQVMHEPNAQASLLETARRELASFQKKYRQLSELAPLMERIDQVLAE